jgi:isoleucyl-tRNA synthetase
MFDLNETINWKPKSTGEGRFGNWIKMPMTGTYPVLGFGNPIANLENRRQTGGNFNRFDRRIIQRNRKVNSGWIPKENPFKGFEMWDEENYDLIDLHKM